MDEENSAEEKLPPVITITIPIRAKKIPKAFSDPNLSRRKTKDKTEMKSGFVFSRMEAFVAVVSDKPAYCNTLKRVTPQRPRTTNFNLSNPEEDLIVSMPPLSGKIGSNAAEAITNLRTAKVSGEIPCRPTLMRMKEEAQNRVTAVSMNHDFKFALARRN